LHPFDLAPGLSEEDVERGWLERPERMLHEFIALKGRLAESGPDPYLDHLCGEADGFLRVFAIPLWRYPGQFLRVAFDEQWRGFWYLGLGEQRPPCDVAMREVRRLILGDDREDP